jgi:PDZ domain-containing secreted protein
MKNNLTMTDFESGDAPFPTKEITITIRNLADLDKLVELEVTHAIDTGKNITLYGGRTVSHTEREITIRALHTIGGNAVGLVFSREILGLCLALLQQHVGGQKHV